VTAGRAARLRIEIPFGIDPGDRDGPRRVDEAGGVRDHLVGAFPVGLIAVVCLKPDGVDDLVDSAELLLIEWQAGLGTPLPDLLDGVTLAEVDGNRADLPGRMTTRIPGWMVSTAAPTCSTTPIGSCPRTSPGVAPIRPSYMCRSVPQIAVDVTRTRASDATSRPTSGTSLMR
jgi:hypothetical protein